jgi:hypothetical protein
LKLQVTLKWLGISTVGATLSKSSNRPNWGKWSIASGEATLAMSSREANGATMKRVDPAAYDQAMREWVVPPCLHLPIVARDRAAIEMHVGDVVNEVSSGRALLVRCGPWPERDLQLSIFNHANIETLFEPLQLWVSPGYTRYRRAWCRSFADADLGDKVLHHVYNRRSAMLRGFGFIRLVPISRRANSSSAFTENWGVAHNTPEHVKRMNRRGLQIQYADLGHLLVMLDISLGGGVQEVFRLGQALIEPNKI